MTIVSPFYKAIYEGDKQGRINYRGDYVSSGFFSIRQEDVGGLGDSVHFNPGMLAEILEIVEGAEEDESIEYEKDFKANHMMGHTDHKIKATLQYGEITITDTSKSWMFSETEITSTVCFKVEHLEDILEAENRLTVDDWKYMWTVISEAEQAEPKILT